MRFKQLFKKWVLNNWKFKIGAIVFAVALWLVITNIQDPEKTKTFSGIPVQILNEDAIPVEDYVYSIASGDTATVVVTGKKSIVDSLSTNDFLATANFQELSQTFSIPIKVSLTGNMSMYSNQIKITQQTTSMILSMDDITCKTLPVELIFVGKLPDNKVIESTLIEPSEIEITAPRLTLSTITKIEAVINVDDIDDGVSLRATPIVYDYVGNIVEMGNGVSSNFSEITATFTVSEVKSVSLMASSSGTPASGYEVDNITCSFDSVMLKGSAEALADIEFIRIPSSRLNVEGAKENVTAKIDITEYLPDGVEIYDSNINVVLTAIIKESETVPTTAPGEKETESAATEETTAEDNEDGTVGNGLD